MGHGSFIARDGTEWRIESSWGAIWIAKYPPGKGTLIMERFENGGSWEANMANAQKRLVEIKQQTQLNKIGISELICFA